MASPFDGMASALNSVFGAPVTVTSLAGTATTVSAIFRETPIDIEVADGRTMQIVTPTLRVRKDLVGGIAKGWIVSPASVAPRTFVVLQTWPNGSPAADAFIICELEESQ